MTALQAAEVADAPVLAALHATAFPHPWDAAALSALLDRAGVFAIAGEDGFILCRVVVDEAEILTLAVDPAARRRGLGLALVEAGGHAAAAAGAERMFLEVAEDNAAARALYARAGFAETGRRRGYYPAADGGRTDALLLSLNLSGPASHDASRALS